MALRALQGPAGGTAPVGTLGGTTNTIPRWTGPSTLGDSIITQDGTSIGVRQATPSAYLFNSVVVGDPALGNAGITLAGGAATDGTLAFADGTVGNAAYRGYVQYSHTTDTLRFGVAGATQMTVLSTGNVGIGTASPGALLDVNTGSAVVGYVTSTRLSQTGTAANSGQRILFYNSAQTWEQGAIGSLREGANNNFSLTFFTSSAGANTERARIDSAGNFGLGVSIPANAATSNGFYLKNNGNLSFLGPIAYFDVNSYYGASADRYAVNGFATRYAQVNGAHIWYVAASGTGGNAISFSESARIDSSNNLILNTANTGATIQAAGTSQGLKLQGTGGTNNTDPNVLDFYADGGTANSGGVTWTPELRFGGASTGVTYQYQVGRYTRIGNMVFATCYISLSSKGSATGAATIAGLPTSSNTSNLFSSGSIGYNVGVTYTNMLLVRMNANASAVTLTNSSAAGALANVTDANFTNTSELVFSIAYPVT